MILNILADVAVNMLLFINHCGKWTLEQLLKLLQYHATNNFVDFYYLLYLVSFIGVSNSVSNMNAVLV